MRATSVFLIYNKNFQDVSNQSCNFLLWHHLLNYCSWKPSLWSQEMPKVSFKGILKIRNYKKIPTFTFNWRIFELVCIVWLTLRESRHSVLFLILASFRKRKFLQWFVSSISYNTWFIKYIIVYVLKGKMNNDEALLILSIEFWGEK